MSDQDETNPTLDLMHINGVHLEIFVEFMHMYAANPILTPIAKPIDYSALPKYATDLLSNLKMVTADMKDLRNTEVSLMSLMYGANMLQIDVLKQLLTGKLIDTIKDVTDSMWTVGAYHPLTKSVNLVAEYSESERDVNARAAANDEKAKAKTISLGAILFF
jgi:hypothetical protein